VKKTLTFLFVSLLLAAEAMSQNYQQSAGIRMGSAGGITYRRMLTSDLSGELMLVSQNHGTALVFLFEKQTPAVLFDDLDMTFIYGAGMHIGAANRYDTYKDSFGYDFRRRYNSIQLGFDAFASFEYMLPKYPVTVSLECKPYFEFFDDHFLGIHLPVIAIGARYTF